MDSSHLSPNFIIPIGTQVVLKKDLEVMGTALGPDGKHLYKKAGSVGVVEQAPLTHEYTYLIRFSDNHTVRAAKMELAVRRAEAPEDAIPERHADDFEQYVIYKVRMGSNAFGLADQNSDTDLRGVYLPPAEWHWSLQPLPEQIEYKRTADGRLLDHNSEADADDVCWWEIEKFIRLALKANPNVLEALYVPDQHIFFADAMGWKLREQREMFMSKYVYQTYSGYVLSQFKKLKKDIESGGTPKHKHSMHLIRLLYSGIEAVRGRGIMVDVGAYRDELLTIKRGEVPFEAVYQKALKLNAEFETAYGQTTLPDRPNVAAADAFLIDARRSRAR